MTTNFTTTADFATVTDGLESVTLLRRAVPGDSGVVIPHALRRAIDVGEVVGENRRTIESDGRYFAMDVNWSIPAAETPDTPWLGDTILDAAGHRWKILEVHLVALGARWRCRTRELSIAYGLEDLVDILVAESETTWIVLHENVRGRIQHIETKVTETDSTAESVRRFRIILEEPFDIDHTHRLRGPDGALYKIVSVGGFPKLGELQTIEVEKIA